MNNNHEAPSQDWSHRTLIAQPSLSSEHEASAEAGWDVAKDLVYAVAWTSPHNMGKLEKENGYTFANVWGSGAPDVERADKLKIRIYTSLQDIPLGTGVAEGYMRPENLRSLAAGDRRFRTIWKDGRPRDATQKVYVVRVVQFKVGTP